MIYILFTHISKNTSCLNDVNKIYFFKKCYSKKFYVSSMNVSSKFQGNFCFSGWNYMLLIK